MFRVTIIFGEFAISRNDKIVSFWAPRRVFYIILVIITFIFLNLKFAPVDLS